MLRKHGVVSHHIFSSTWPSIKSQISVVKENCGWQLGSGADINFWTDLWLSEPLVNMSNIPDHLLNQLNARVEDFIINDKWNVLRQPLSLFPDLLRMLQIVDIPQFDAIDQLVWTNSFTGVLTFRDAYLHFKPAGQSLHWAKLIWNSAIPPTRSFLV